MTFGVAMLLLCDAWRVWLVATYLTLYVADRATATTIAPWFIGILFAVSVYDTVNLRRRRA